jgi:adenine-specific DNA-methyltransferase
MMDIHSESDTHLLNSVDQIRLNAQLKLDRMTQSEFGQFFTPSRVASTLANFFELFPEEVTLLDPGAGVGILSAAFIDRLTSSYPLPKRIRLVAYEIDTNLYAHLSKTMELCRQKCDYHQIYFEYQIRQEDFIASAAEVIRSRNSFFPARDEGFNYAILNPPYHKINSSSKTRELLSSIGIETTNLYTAFLWLTMELLVANGELSAIVPRSFCNGPYYLPFRKSFLREMSLEKIHLFDSRRKAFSDDNVLQENILIHAKKTKEHANVLIHSSNGPDDENILSREIPYDELVHPNDPQLFIRIVPDDLANQVSQLIKAFPSTLNDLGLNVSTGKVVDFRSRDMIVSSPISEPIPLIYPQHIKNGKIVFPNDSGNKNFYFKEMATNENAILPLQNLVLVKRFSSKEEKRRIQAGFLDSQGFKYTKIAIENHVNYFYRTYGRISSLMAKGLTLFLNSSICDLYFRQFSGHTQVNATDLKNMRYPSEEQLVSLGSRIASTDLDQDTIDDLIMEVVIMGQAENQISDPIAAKKKITEALDILNALNVPAQQQNERSALTLLALANVKASSKWSEAESNLIGITEMMDYFRNHYGKNYAPNTRETVRKMTIHQFIQLGIVHANPDSSERPINSPKTRYEIVAPALHLIQTYNSPAWNEQLSLFIRNTPSLNNLQVRERLMPMIDIILPDGERIKLSAGGQNELIKQVIEEFCQRYTPGGKVIYIGDANQKITEQELLYFSQLGIKINQHGKMPDVVVLMEDKKWLVIIEAVTSHGPIDIKRHNELKELFENPDYGLVFVTAFQSRRAMNKYLKDLSWETDVWVAESPSHLIHFDGERFLGPYL